MGNLVEQLAGVLHGRSSRAKSTEINELDEYKDIILEVGFYGICLDLLEFFEGGAVGQET